MDNEETKINPMKNRKIKSPAQKRVNEQTEEYSAAIVRRLTEGGRNVLRDGRVRIASRQRIQLDATLRSETAEW
jgi:hypothetical protein